MARLRTIIVPEGEEERADLRDLRFCALLGAAAWSRLPATVRARLQQASRIRCGGDLCRHHRRQPPDAAGRLLAELCRLIGGPLPLDADVGVPAVVTVTEDGTSGGQFWTRMYGRLRGFPQVIHSSKRFAGPTGLEEYLGRGFGIALDGERRRAGAALPQRPLFPRLGRTAIAAAALARPRCTHHQPRRSGRGAVRLRAVAHPSVVRRDHPPDRHLPRTSRQWRCVMSDLLWLFVFLQMAMGGFDTFYHHELTERLAWRPAQAGELRLHGVRNLAYAVTFMALRLERAAWCGGARLDRRADRRGGDHAVGLRRRRIARASCRRPSASPTRC